MTYKMIVDRDEDRILSAAADTEPVQSDTGFDFLYNAVPFGEYPEADTEAIRNKTAAASSLLNQND
ncbi:MAG: hypothetical protein E6X17_02820 [Sporomusaceae bacterium]|nr:hypothetical protein [Sporomusaceae bacterium]